MKTFQLNIEGMTCGHCVMSVKKELSKLADVTVKNVNIGSAVVEADESESTKGKLKTAVEEAGYSLVSIQ